MKVKKLIIFLIVISISLIGIGTVYSVYTKEPTEKKQIDEEEKSDKPTEPNDPENHKITELKSVITPDKKLRLGTTRVYEYEGLTGMMLNIVPLEDFANIYLKITMQLAKSKEDVVIHLENLQKGIQVEREIQTLNDWSTLKSWSIEIIPEEEAKKIWDSQSKEKSTE
ncbi:MAG: hypothetical protein IJE53_00785 [Bacilli bacterium]|nr:hypothetical protein [Bacilli bacterium]